MRISVKHRMAIAWMLLMTFIPLFVVKAVHVHNEKEVVVCHSNACHFHTASAPDHCPICHFTISPFGEAHFQEFIFQSQQSVDGLFTLTPLVVVRSVIRFNLRAPPFSC